MNRGRRHVALVGLRCAGKTTVGLELAQLFGAPFLDLDDEVVRAANATTASARFTTAGEVLAAWGEPTFRSLESDALRTVLESREGRVLATGGGVVLASKNRALLARHARCIWLRADPALLARRLRADPTPRPALRGGDAAAELEQLAQERTPLYAEIADITVEADRPPAEVARTILERLVGEGPAGPG